jgi:hypothetical protein
MSKTTIVNKKDLENLLEAANVEKGPFFKQQKAAEEKHKAFKTRANAALITAVFLGLGAGSFLLPPPSEIFDWTCGISLGILCWKEIEVRKGFLAEDNTAPKKGFKNQIWLTIFIVLYCVTKSMSPIPSRVSDLLSKDQIEQIQKLWKIFYLALAIIGGWGQYFYAKYYLKAEKY